MTLLASVEKSSKRPGTQCSYAALRESLKPAERAELDKVMAEPRYTHAQIARGLAAEGHKGITQQVVTRHRNNGCVTCAH